MKMDNFEFLVCQLEVGCESKNNPAAQHVAEQIAEQYFLPGQAIVGRSTHYARTELNEIEDDLEEEVAE